MKPPFDFYNISIFQNLNSWATVEKCLLSNDIYDYYNVSQGKITIPSMDDGEESTLTDVSGPRDSSRSHILQPPLLFFYKYHYVFMLCRVEVQKHTLSALVSTPQTCIFLRNLRPFSIDCNYPSCIVSLSYRAEDLPTWSVTFTWFTYSTLSVPNPWKLQSPPWKEPGVWRSLCAHLSPSDVKPEMIEMKSYIPLSVLKNQPKCVVVNTVYTLSTVPYHSCVVLHASNFIQNSLVLFLSRYLSPVVSLSTFFRVIVCLSLFLSLSARCCTLYKRLVVVQDKLLIRLFYR